MVQYRALSDILSDVPLLRSIKIMIVIEKSKQLLGDDYSAYLFNLIANSVWVIGLLKGTEDKRINSIYMGQLRGLGILIISWIIAKVYSVPIHFPNWQDLKVMNARNFLMTVHGFMFAFSFHYLEVPIVYTISNTGPLLVFVLDYFLNGAAVARKQLVGIIVASAGITLAVNSHVIYERFGWEDGRQSSFEYIPATAIVKMMVALIFFLFSVGWAYGILLTRRLK